VLFDGQTGSSFQGGTIELQGVEESLNQAVRQGAHCQKEHGVDIWPISLGGHSIGALAVQGLKASDGALQALLNLVAIAIERVRTENATNRAEAARQSEEFKSTLLDAVAHEFKTPLTSIKAASTALLADEHAFTPETNELLSIINEETDRLNSLVTEAVRMSQIDAGKIRLERAAVSVEALLDPAIASFGNRADGRIERVETAIEIHVDREMILLALRQLIDNALKYSPPSTMIRLWADRRDDRVVIHVADQGPGIPEADRDRIFEKFFRRQKVRDKVPGSGLGLHIAREIARMHGGDLWVFASEGGGSEFCLALPTRAEVGA
jgi:two-component system, OmpR family, sensor histidine kinase KdpD